MRHLMNSKTAVPCALLAILLGPLSAYADAYAAPGYEVATRTVKYGDLDLSRAEGAAHLYSRIHVRFAGRRYPPDRWIRSWFHGIAWSSQSPARLPM